MRIFERPTTIQCQAPDCGIDVPVGTRGPIPQFCPEHRGRPKNEQLAPRVTLYRHEVDGLRAGKEDALMLLKTARENFETERAQHWKTKELLRDARLELEAAKRELDVMSRLYAESPKPVTYASEDDIEAAAGEYEPRVVGRFIKVERDEQGLTASVEMLEDLDVFETLNSEPEAPIEDAPAEIPSASAGTTPLPPVPAEADVSEEVVESKSNFADFTSSLPDPASPAGHTSQGRGEPGGPMTGFE